MNLTMEAASGAHLVRRYGDGEILVGDTRLVAACIVSPRRLIANVRPQRPADLLREDLDAVFELAPEVVIVGWAGGQPYLPLRQRAWFLERRIGLEAMELGAACRTYNVLAQDERNAVALLFPAREA